MKGTAKLLAKCVFSTSFGDRVAEQLSSLLLEFIYKTMETTNSSFSEVLIRYFKRKFWFRSKFYKEISLHYFRRANPSWYSFRRRDLVGEIFIKPTDGQENGQV
jgi:hypothetical protein